MAARASGFSWGMEVDLQEHLEQEVEREKTRLMRKLVYAILMLFAVYIFAVLVFHFVEKWGWEDSVYFTTSTITTVGYGDLVPQTRVGRLFTIPLMLIGIGVGFYVIYTIQEYGRAKLDAVSRRVDELGERQIAFAKGLLEGGKNGKGEKQMPAEKKQPNNQ